MKPYGMTRQNAGDLDVVGCVSNGRATRCYNLKEHAYRSLRNGKKAKIRIHAKRAARLEGKKACLIVPSDA